MKKGKSRSRMQKAVIGMIPAVILVFSVVVSAASLLPFPDCSYNERYNDITRETSPNIGSCGLDRYSNTMTLAVFGSTIDVSAAKTSVKTITSVAVGEPLVVTGTTNREEGFVIVVSVKGPVELPSEIVKVENGAFKAIIDTSTAKVGTYSVQADDGDGHTDATTVNIFPPNSILETGPGTITPNCTITVSKHYTWPCPGMAWNSEHVKIGYVSGTVTGQSWDGYHEESWFFIGFPYPFILVAGE